MTHIVLIVIDKVNIDINYNDSWLDFSAMALRRIA